ncbi:MAG: MIP family channel protein [Chloroflexi bacterium]|nr:MIP family channel protein [Chloroflexota bacterium]
MSIQLGFQPGDFTLKTWRGAAAEFIGTGLFVFLGTGTVVSLLNVLGGPPVTDPAFVTGVAIAHGLGILLAVAATANISGGYINPAVTFAAAMTGKLKISTAVLYVAAQLAAAVLAVLLLKAVIAGPAELGHLGAHSLNTAILEDQVGDGAGAGLLVEIVLTFALVFVVFATAIDPKGPKHLAPAAIGLVILADHFVGVPLTGASMNPARSFGPALVANFWDDQWVYWLGPLIGGGAAALVYEYVFLNREE